MIINPPEYYDITGSSLISVDTCLRYTAVDWETKCVTPVHALYGANLPSVSTWLPLLPPPLSPTPDKKPSGIEAMPTLKIN